MRDWLKSLEKSEKRRVSGVEKLDIVRFILEHFSKFPTQIKF